MTVQYKSSRQIEQIRKAGKIVAEILGLISENVKPGITTGELEKLAVERLKRRNAKSAFLGYQGFPANICVSIDDEVVHGIPGNIKLAEGQIVSVDVGAIVGGYFGDSARTFPVGTVSDQAGKLIDVTEKSLHEGIEKCVFGNHLGDLSAAIQSYVEAEGFSVVRDLVGHGIGKKMH